MLQKAQQAGSLRDEAVVSYGKKKQHNSCSHGRHRQGVAGFIEATQASRSRPPAADGSTKLQRHFGLLEHTAPRRRTGADGLKGFGVGAPARANGHGRNRPWHTGLEIAETGHRDQRDSSPHRAGDHAEGKAPHAWAPSASGRFFAEKLVVEVIDHARLPAVAIERQTRANSCPHPAAGLVIGRPLRLAATGGSAAPLVWPPAFEAIAAGEQALDSPSPPG